MKFIELQEGGYVSVFFQTFFKKKLNFNRHQIVAVHRFVSDIAQGFFKLNDIRKGSLHVGSLFQQAFDVVLKRGKQIAATEKKGFELEFDQIFSFLLVRFWQEI